MKLQLKGEVGSTGGREDVITVQALLANIGPGAGAPFWSGGLTGTGSDALGTAIAAFQEHVGIAKRGSGQMTRATDKRGGRLAPNSPTWQALLRQAPKWMAELRVLPGLPVIAYATEDLRRNAQAAVGVIELEKTVVDQRARGALIQGLLRLEQNHGLIGGVTWTGLDKQLRLSARVEFRHLRLLRADNGKAEQPKSGAAPVPQKLWSALDQALNASGWKVSTGHHGTGGTFHHGEPLATQQEIQAGRKAFADMSIRPSDYRVDEALLAAAVGLIGKVGGNDRAEKTRLDQIIEQISVSDKKAATQLRELRNGMMEPGSDVWLEHQTSETILAFFENHNVSDQAFKIIGILVNAISLGVAIRSLNASAAAASRATATARWARRFGIVGVALEALALGYQLMNIGKVNNLKRELNKCLDWSNGGSDGTSLIDIPNNRNRKEYLMKLFGIRVLCVPGDMEPKIFDLMERILLSGIRGSGVINHRIEKEIMKIRYIDERAGSRLNQTFIMARERTNATNLKFRPTIALRRMLYQAEITPILIEMIEAVSAATAIKRVKVIEVVTYGVGKSISKSRNSAANELRRRGIHVW
jgi:hypothetical protein